MKKMFLTLAAIVALGTTASASTTIVNDTVQPDSNSLFLSVNDTVQPDSTSKFSSDIYLQENIASVENTVAPVVIEVSKVPQLVKDAVAKDYPGSTIEKAAYDATTKIYTLSILPKEAKKTIEVKYTETGEKVETK